MLLRSCPLCFSLIVYTLSSAYYITPTNTVYFIIFTSKLVLLFSLISHHHSWSARMCQEIRYGGQSWRLNVEKRTGKSRLKKSEKEALSSRVTSKVNSLDREVENCKSSFRFKVCQRCIRMVEVLSRRGRSRKSKVDNDNGSDSWHKKEKVAKTTKTTKKPSDGPSPKPWATMKWWLCQDEEAVEGRLKDCEQFAGTPLLEWFSSRFSASKKPKSGARTGWVQIHSSTTDSSTERSLTTDLRTGTRGRRVCKNAKPKQAMREEVKKE